MVGIAPENLDTVWDEVEPFIESAILDHNFESTTQAYNQIKNNEMVLFIGANPENEIVVVCVVEILVSGVKPLYKRLNCVYLAGNGIEDWMEFLYTYLENYALSKGCQDVQIVGREGWLRKIKRYKKVAAVMINDLSDKYE